MEINSQFEQRFFFVVFFLTIILSMTVTLREPSKLPGDIYLCFVVFYIIIVLFKSLGICFIFHNNKKIKSKTQ